MLPRKTRIALPVVFASLVVAACSGEPLGARIQDGEPVSPPTTDAAEADAHTNVRPWTKADAARVDASAEEDADADADVDAAPDASAPLAPYTCSNPPAQCNLACTPGACTLACSPTDPTDCTWSCAAPDCACTDAPNASCDLHDPVGACDVKCEKPECETRCPLCTTSPCDACTTVCKQPHCVTHCQAPRFVADSGAARVVRCQAPKPSCTTTCAEPICTWQPSSTGTGFDAACERPACTVTCAPPPAPVCALAGCAEQCDPLGACTQQCDKPNCAADPNTGVVTCDAAPTGCTETCTGGACHVTTCD